MSNESHDRSDVETDRRTDDSERSTVDRRAFSRAVGLGVVGSIATLDRLSVRGSGGSSQRENEDADENAIAAENARSGDGGWEPATLVDGDLEGYTTATSVQTGETLELCVSAGGSYRTEIYRIGWYDGDGGRLVANTAGSEPRQQPIVTAEGAYDMVECDWDVTDRLEVGEDWTSGLYYAWLVRTDGDGSYAHPFVVRSSRPSADVVVQLPLATQQAYNGWPGADRGGKSLYGFSSDGWRADAVSHDRPYEAPFDHHLTYAVHLVRWLEREGYSIEYLCDSDVHRNPERVREYAVAVSAGHDEYWSLAQYDAFLSAREDGTNLAVLGANVCYWRVHYEDDGRTIYCPKIEAEDLFRNIGRHEARLLGLASFGYQPDGRYPSLTVDASGLEHDYLADTGFEPGDRVDGVVGHEWAWIHDESPDDLHRFFHYEAGSQFEVQRDRDCDTVAFTADSGATVFHCGTLAWPWRLDPDPTWDTTYPFAEARRHDPTVSEPDERLQRFQANVFRDLLE
ncbi:hypothetical protein OB955_23290 [Halobacteria archaeon AArc-m2/3/4]|uniref:N,N-dimethylformamidase beta subunit-like C-terminal domain-containing protein n=1 Tax=Natronoglomus mannanivorans TaxID=2979990 RepID=A0ABT2QL07_9EURY|nr:hypothetical protein [Halobacteria archaeon AArc-m2/3/4]